MYYSGILKKNILSMSKNPLGKCKKHPKIVMNAYLILIKLDKFQMKLQQPGQYLVLRWKLQTIAVMMHMIPVLHLVT